jgi:hypothetical protein
LNLVTDTYEPVLKEVPVYTEHSYNPIHQEPVQMEPLEDLKDVVTSLKMAVEMVERDAPPFTKSWYDLYDNHYNDVSYEVPVGVSMNTFARKPLNPSSVMVPVVKSYVSRINNPPSYRNTLTAMVKRNFNVPALEEITSSYENVYYSVTNMFNCCLKPGWKKAFKKYYHKYSIHNFFDTNKAYVNQLAPGKAAKFNLDEMLPYWVTNKNMFKEHTNMLKSKAKFPLKGEIKSEYTVNATINYHKPEVNAISSSIFRNIITRLKVWMRDNCVLMIEKNRVDFETFFFTNFEKKKYIKIGKRKISLEIDYSKFDKSQTERCAMIEMFIYSMLGMDKDFLIYWYESLESSSVYNYHDLIKAFIEWQRRTGTATTALGNTLITMVTVCSVLFPDYPEDDIDGPFDLAAFLGDDSSIIVRDDYIVPDNITDKLNTWYNLSAKFDIMDHIYFCSSFIIYLPGKGCKMIPDPKKRLLSLTLPLSTNLDDVYESMTDSCSSYLEDKEYLHVLARDAAKRYKTSIEDMMFVIRTIKSTLHSKEVFSSLYKPLSCVFG